jgi:hypothetical protein
MLIIYSEKRGNMSLSRKHFTELAAIVKEIRELSESDSGYSPTYTIDMLENRLVSFCHKHSANFNGGIFREACKSDKD